MGITSMSAQAAPLKLKPLTTGKKRSVVILGAGISGLTSAYELSRAGYDVTVLEASHRAGGRNFTARHGDFIDEFGNPQICKFDDKPYLYMNCGPARIPAVHTGLMHYCRELGVELMLFSNDNVNCYTQDDKAFDGRPIRIREYRADIRGYMSELLEKTMASSAHLDAPFDEVDLDKMVQFVKDYGDLGSDLKYHGSERAGLVSGGFVSEPVIKDPLRFADLMKSSYWAGALNFAEGLDQAPAMLTPVGGMDHVVKGFLKHVKDKISLKAQVQKVWLEDKGVEVSYLHDGVNKKIKADYCINCIPTHIMAGIENNFPTEYAEVLGKIQRGKLFKIGFQAKERFWEKEGIYNGITWTSQDINQIWYPEHSPMRPKGIFLGAYTWDPAVGERFAQMSNQQRMNEAIRQGSKIHPDYAKYVETGITVCWERMNNMMGCSSQWPEDIRDKFALLQAPAGNRHYMVGDQISHHSGWQEGAIRSAWHALEDIEQKEGMLSAREAS
ncbi:flavin monoamine oxidase family protein [Gallaecimonas mangrovi]|uniref:flavin monoamine oxidase family protein n=1 Tax=Gallaecimonas mangrovi TaxID=2291597 RepID=UPI0018694F72|nr:FAD-dependent oxidoreductase [Gallaecimonas mangrovi]